VLSLSPPPLLNATVLPWELSKPENQELTDFSSDTRQRWSLDRVISVPKVIVIHDQDTVEDGLRDMIFFLRHSVDKVS